MLRTALVVAGVLASCAAFAAEDAARAGPVQTAEQAAGVREAGEQPPVGEAASGTLAPAPVAPTATLESGLELTYSLAKDLDAGPGDLWDRIRAGFAMPDLDGRQVREAEAWYAARPDYVRRMVERSKRYLFYVVAEVERRGMPMEIALLPMIESAYNPHAYSRAHASGMWQFIPSTGKNFGLQQNWWYDGRRDVVAATRAALDYLQTLYGMFGDWHLALAAYNWGEGAVARALMRNQNRGLPLDYVSLTMPAETRAYVPRLVAVKNIIAAPSAFGLELEPVPNRPYFRTVALDRPMDVKLAARLAGVSFDEFVMLNPAHSRPVLGPGSHTLLLPEDRADDFTASLDAHDEALVSWRSYTLQRGEGIEQVARRTGVSVARLREANGISPRQKVGPGFVLLVPDPAAAAPAAGTIAASAPPVAKRGVAGAVHVVQRGETLFAVAQRHGVTAEQLRAWNGLQTNQVVAGQRLRLDAPTPQPARLAETGVKGKGDAGATKAAPAAKHAAAKQTSPKATRYTVRRGDTVSSIARRFKVEVDDVQRWNRLRENASLRPGERVTLYLASND